MVRRTVLLCSLMAAALFAQDAGPDVIFQTAVNDLAAQRFAEAEAGFRRLRATEPGNVRGVVGVGQTLLAQGKMALALQYLMEETTKDPDNAKLNLVLGDLAEQAGQFDIASFRFEKVLVLLGKDPNAATFFVKRSSKRPPESVRKPLEAAVDNFTGKDETPAGPGGVYVRLAECYLSMGNGVRGIAALESARSYFPGNLQIVLNLALLYEMGRDQPHAIAAYREVVKLAPDNAAALNNLAFLLAETGGDLDEALKLSLHANELASNSPEVIDTLGWVYVKRKEWVEATRVLGGLVATAPDRDAYREHLRVAMEGSGAESETVKQIMGLLKTPVTPASSQALKDVLGRMYPPK